MSYKKIILIAIIILVLVFLSYKFFLNKKNNDLKLEKAIIGDIIQEISETGAIKPTEEINLGFKTAGRIEKINVRVGDMVEKGKELASLDKTQLFIQLNQAHASLAVVDAQYNKLLAGSTSEEIKVAENLKKLAQDDLNKAYQDALNTLDDAYLKIYNTHNAIVLIQANYFSAADQEGIKIQDNKTVIDDNLKRVKVFLDTSKTSLNYNDIDTALFEMKASLKNTSDALKIIRETCEQGIYYSKVVSADKTIIDNHRAYIIAILTGVTNAQQTISSKKIFLQKAEDELILKKAKPRQEDIDYYQAKIKEARANIDFLEHQIWEATLRAPINGIITKINKKTGETAQANDLPISLISLDPLQIEVDIYEEDIVKVQINNPVNIKIIAFPNETFKGRVVFINPAEKIIERVVYYEIVIAFDELKESIKTGMTVDVLIRTAIKKNVLTLSKEGIIRKNGKITVLVLKNGREEEREIQIGLEGNNGRVEVLSGLSEGEEVVIK